MAVWVLGVQLTHKTVQKDKNAAKTIPPKAIYIALKYSQGSYRCGMVKRWGQTDKYKPRYGSLGFWSEVEGTGRYKK